MTLTATSLFLWASLFFICSVAVDQGKHGVLAFPHLRHYLHCSQNHQQDAPVDLSTEMC